MLTDKSKLIVTKQVGVDARVDEILQNPTSPLALLFSKAEDLNKNKLKKGYIEASLICETDLRKVARVLEISEEILSVYFEFFFDVTGWGRLDKIEHIENLRSLKKDASNNEALLKLWAVSHGLEFIAWRLGHKTQISPVEGLTDLFSLAMYKSKEAMFNNSSSEAGKESTKWVKLSTDISRLLKLWVLDSSAAKRDLEIAIREVVPDFGGLEDILKQEIEIEQHVVGLAILNPTTEFEGLDSLKD